MMHSPVGYPGFLNAIHQIRWAKVLTGKFSEVISRGWGSSSYKFCLPEIHIHMNHSEISEGLKVLGRSGMRFNQPDCVTKLSTSRSVSDSELCQYWMPASG